MAKQTFRMVVVSVVCTISAATLATAQPRGGKRPPSNMAIVPLGALAGTYSHGSDINDRGQILALSSNGAGFFRPMLWDRGKE